MTQAEKIDWLMKNVRCLLACNPCGGGSGPVVDIEHNSTLLKQGGDELLDEYFHLSQDQYTRVLDLILEELTSSLSLSPTTGERGLATNITINYNIESNDDIITSATINQGVGSILSGVDQGPQTISGGSRVNNTIYNLNIGFTRGGNFDFINQTVSYITYIPQWSGLSTEIDISILNYNTISGLLNKLVQSSDTISIDVAPSTQYVWFVSTNPNAAITNNGFNVSIGNWGDFSKFFMKKTVVLLLADNTTTASLTFYRSSSRLTHPTQNYTIT